jgi:hypothetical protein
MLCARPAAAWLILAVNGIMVRTWSHPAQVTVTSLILILIAALVALHYRERTAAQFIFSAAVVVILSALACRQTTQPVDTACCRGLQDGAVACPRAVTAIVTAL